jgi:hypothetical protein
MKLTSKERKGPTGRFVTETEKTLTISVKELTELIKAGIDVPGFIKTPTGQVAYIIRPEPILPPGHPSLTYR